MSHKNILSVSYLKKKKKWLYYRRAVKEQIAREFYIVSAQFNRGPGWGNHPFEAYPGNFFQNITFYFFEYKQLLFFHIYVSPSQPFWVTLSCQITEPDYTRSNQPFGIRIGQTETRNRKDEFHLLRKKNKNQSQEKSTPRMTRSLSSGPRQPDLLINSSSPSWYACAYRHRSDQGDKSDGELTANKKNNFSWLNNSLRSLRMFLERKYNSFPGFVLKGIIKTGDQWRLGNIYSFTLSIYMAKDLIFQHFFCCSNHTPAAQLALSTSISSPNSS